MASQHDLSLLIDKEALQLLRELAGFGFFDDAEMDRGNELSRLKLRCIDLVDKARGAASDADMQDWIVTGYYLDSFQLYTTTVRAFDEKHAFDLATLSLEADERQRVNWGCASNAIV